MVSLPNKTFSSHSRTVGSLPGRCLPRPIVALLCRPLISHLISPMASSCSQVPKQEALRNIPPHPTCLPKNHELLRKMRRSSLKMVAGFRRNINGANWCPVKQKPLLSVTWRFLRLKLLAPHPEHSNIRASTNSSSITFLLLLALTEPRNPSSGVFSTCMLFVDPIPSYVQQMILSSRLQLSHVKLVKLAHSCPFNLMNKVFM